MTHINVKRKRPEPMFYIGKAAAIISTMKKKRKDINKSDAAAMMLASFACGIIMGFLISPARAGFGNNVNNSTNNYYFNADLTDSPVQ